jgi:hypothetical protein
MFTNIKFDDLGIICDLAKEKPATDIYRYAWDVFAVDGNQDHLAIERVDDSASVIPDTPEKQIRFDSDAVAYAYVLWRVSVLQCPEARTALVNMATNGALDQLSDELDEWFEGDVQERTAEQMIDWVRSAINNAIHPRWLPERKYPESDWQYEVANGDTRVGYAEWLANKVEMEG